MSDYTIATTAGVIIAQVEHHDLTVSDDYDHAEIAFRTVLAFNSYRSDNSDGDIEHSITDLIADLTLLGTRDYGMEL